MKKKSRPLKAPPAGIDRGKTPLLACQLVAVTACQIPRHIPAGAGRLCESFLQRRASQNLAEINEILQCDISTWRACRKAGSIFQDEHHGGQSILGNYFTHASTLRLSAPFLTTSSRLVSTGGPRRVRGFPNHWIALTGRPYSTVKMILQFLVAFKVEFKNTFMVYLLG